MTPSPRITLLLAIALLAALVHQAASQEKTYDVYPDADPPYYRVRYEASDKPGELVYPVKYTVWIPPNVETLRGVVVHQHGCGEGSCKSGLTGAFDLHWQALAAKHDCALLAPSYEQPGDAECQMWCDPRNGSGVKFQQGLRDLGEQSGHPELATVPWALWGHSGGGHWAGGIVMLHPERVAAAWLRSGVPLFEPLANRPSIKTYTLPDTALNVPMMCNPGTKEGYTVTDGRFAGVWPVNEAFFSHVRGQGGLLGVAIDPLTAHECGNSRYLAIPWLDVCLTHRLPDVVGQPLREMPKNDVWLAELKKTSAVEASQFSGDPNKAIWLPSGAIAKSWMQFVRDTQVPDTTRPPAPTNVRLIAPNILTWDATADLESGLSHFVVEHNGKEIGTAPEKPKNRFGRPLFQGLQYSDTPEQPLAQMRFKLDSTKPTAAKNYRVIAVNTAGLRSDGANAKPIQ